MLDPGRYLLGVLEVVTLIGFAGLGGWSIKRRCLDRLTGASGLLAAIVPALALLIWPAEALGTFGAWTAGAYIALVVLIAVALWASLGRVARGEGGEDAPARNPPPPATGPARRNSPVPTLIALAIALIAVLHFASGVRSHLSTGLTGFDSTWYHGPFAAGFFQSGDTWRLHFIAPQFLAWFYPANGEIFHAAGMLAFGRDLLSPFVNLGWFVGSLFACWCIGRPYRVAPWSLGLGAIALSVPALADQAGEARNDIVGIFFLLAAVALAVSARAGSYASGGRSGSGRSGSRSRALEGDRSVELAPAELAVIGLAAGLAAGTKLNFLLPAAVLVLGLAVIAPRGTRARALLVAGLGAVAGGGYWYLRNLAHTGNPLPWAHHLGPISLPAPEQALGGREAHSVLGYLGDSSVWSDWFLPGLHQGLWIVWPALLAAALAGLVLAVLSVRSSPAANAEAQEQGGWRSEATAAGPAHSDAALAIAGLVGLAAALAWLLAPTSASGPDGVPRGFESGLRYLAPALVLGLALLPASLPLRSRLRSIGSSLDARLTFAAHSARKVKRTLSASGHRRAAGLLGAVALLAAIAIGYPVQRHYLRDRYADPSFSAPGLNAAFAWARGVSGARIATTSTRQYPLFGTDLSNRVQYLGIERPHGGFEAPSTCPPWRRLLNAGHYDYVIATRDRIEPGKPPYPPTARWTEAPGVREILRKPPTVVFQLAGKLDPSACR